MAKAILDVVGKPHDLIEYIDDFNIRPGHDRRYAISCEKIFKAVDWTPRIDLDRGLENVVQWYLRHPEWLRAV